MTMTDETLPDLLPEMPAPIDGSDRSRYLGGSDLAATLGLNPWRTPLELQMEKLGEIPGQGENDAMRWGKLLEAPIAAEYSRRSGLVCVEAPFVSHPEWPFLGGHPDRYAFSATEPTKRRVVEIKTSAEAKGFGEEGTDDIPDYYQVQVQHYMGLCEMTQCDVVLLIAGRNLRCYSVQRNDRLVKAIWDHGRRWWETHIIDKKPVEPQTTKEVAMQALAWADVKGKTLVASPIVEAAWRNFLNTRAAFEKLEKQLDMDKLAVMEAMDEKQADTLLSPEGKVWATWRSQESNRVDIKRLRAEAPEVAARFMQKGLERRFLVKE